jgi:HPt (histidine-containing phosphotransfer) domain-containing protein
MKTKPEGPQPLDRAKLLAECDNEESFANRCLHIFIREAQKDMNGISAALERNDFFQVARLAHRLKGAAASIRAEFLRQQAERLEVFGNSADSVAAGECYSRLQADFEQFKAFIADLPLLPD